MATAVLAVRTLQLGRSDLFGTASRACVGYAAVAMLSVLSFNLGSKSGKFGQRLSILLNSLIAVGSVAATTSRLAVAPIRFNSADDKMRLALRLAAHEMTSAAPSQLLRTIPADWPYPQDVELAFSADSGGIAFVASRILGRMRVCESAIALGESISSESKVGPRCRSSRASDTSFTFKRPERLSFIRDVPRKSQASTVVWPQYRRDNDRTASVALDGDSPQRGWTAELDGSARSTASVADKTVLVGAHETGSLGAFELSTGALRWRTRVPNWIHQDAVSDGTTVVVGYGDNLSALTGHSWGGVAAYDLTSGRLIWTKFERGSVMTSPVIANERVIYITLTGMLQIRSLVDGRSIDSLSLPGGAVMASPSIIHRELVAALDPNIVCVIGIDPAKVRWCSALPGVDLLGDAAPTVLSDTIYVSAREPMTAGAWLTGLPSRPVLDSWTALYRRFLGLIPTKGVGQRLYAFNARNGSLLWRSELFPATRYLDGHISGTAVATRDLIVAILPTADQLVALDRRTLSVKWRRSAGGARGPILVEGTHLYLAEANGTIRVLDPVSGVERCSLALGRHIDRAGPTSAGGLLIVATVEGDLIAVPKRYIDDCSQDSVSQTLRALPPARVR